MQSIGISGGTEEVPVLSVTSRGWLWETLQSWWVALVFISCGLLSWLAFLYIGIRTKSRAWILAGFVYLVPIVFAASADRLPITDSGFWYTAVILSFVIFPWVISFFHAVKAREKFLLKVAGEYNAEYFPSVVRSIRSTIRQKRIYTEHAARAVSEFPYPLEACTGDKAPLTLAELRRQGYEGGFTPILLGDAHDVEIVLDNYRDLDITTEEILAKSKTIDARAWFEERVNQDPEYYKAVESGKWPTGTGPVLVSARSEALRQKKGKTVYIAKVPTIYDWQVPAYLKLGGWNECPTPEVHVAIAKYWREEYGAMIATATGEIIEYEVAKPPSGREAALALAKEQSVFCSDLVYQGCETLRNLAAKLIGAQRWCFWWD